MTSEEFRNNPLFLRNQFESDGNFDMPIIRKQYIDLSNVRLIGYDQTKREDAANSNKFVHFFLDDYKFQVIWNDPQPRLQKLSQYKGVLSPQFSTYYTMPTTLQIYNTFRSRWCGAYLQSKGINVIPTISWGLPKSYWYCFDGIEEGSIVAVSTLGVRREKDFFLQGYNEMMKRIKPLAVICYCEPFDEMEGNIITVDYAETNNLGQNKDFRLLGDNREYKMYSTEPRQNAVEENKQYVVSLSQRWITAGMGGGGREGRGTSAGGKNRSIPKKVYQIIRHIKEKNGAPLPGYKGGKVYRNKPIKNGQKLPDGVNYREYDVNPYSKGTDRGAERIVIGDDGSAWYTDNHYETFTRID